MKEIKFKRVIQIGDNVTDIIKLKCVNYVSKQLPFEFTHSFCYHLYAGLMHDYREDLSHRCVAFKGDWLCEDEEGHWYIISNKEYQREYAHGI